MTQRQDETAQVTSNALDADGKPLEDTALRSVSKDELKRLSIDAWEPSLLRYMLEAQNKLQNKLRRR